MIHLAQVPGHSFFFFQKPVKKYIHLLLHHSRGSFSTFSWRHTHTFISLCARMCRWMEKQMATHSSVLPWRIPGTGGAWWAAVYVVTQSRTRLKRLSSSMILCYRLVMWFIIALIFHIFWRQVRPCVVRGWSLPVMRNFAFYPNVIENCISYLIYDIKTVAILE